MTIAGLFLRSARAQNFLQNPPNWFGGLQAGLFSAAISIIGIAVYKLGKKSCTTKLTQSLMLLTSILTLLIRVSWALPIYLLVSGVISYIAFSYFEKRFGNFSTEDQKNAKSEPDTQQTETSPLIQHVPSSRSCRIIQNRDQQIGLILVALFFVLFVALILLKRIIAPPNLYILLAELFYRIGSIIYGGGQVSGVIFGCLHKS